MPGQRLTSNLGVAARAAAPAPAPVPLNGYYPKLLQGNSGSVWLLDAAKTGVIVHLSDRPQKAKHYVGYRTAKLNESKMRPYTGPITLNAA